MTLDITIPPPKSGIRLLACGGREYQNALVVDWVLETIHREHKITMLIHGAARGADTLASQWAIGRGIPTEPYPVTRSDLRRLGKRAGHLRNSRMLLEGRPDVVVAFPGGPGTTNMVMQARRESGVIVLRVTDEGKPTIVRL